MGRYLPERSIEFKERIQIEARRSMVGSQKITGPVRVVAVFYKTANLTKRRYGDIDNLVKAILDALNGIVFEDDAQVVELVAFKRIGEPRTELEVSEIDCTAG